MATSFRPSIIHLVPVLSSTASVAFCFTEYWTLLPFLQPSIPSQSISVFWNSYLYQTIPGWVGFGLTSTISGYISYRRLTGAPKSLYGWGVVLALGHYAFGPSVAKIIEAAVYGPPEKAKDGIITWLKYHTARMLLTDIPSMACFVCGFMRFI